MPTDTATILRAARAKIDRPECWTKDIFAKSRHGALIQMTQDSRLLTARKYCAEAAVWAVTGDDINLAKVALEKLRQCLRGGWAIIYDYNDSTETTHADILALYDRAIAAAEQSP